VLRAKRRISAVRADPAQLLNAQALVPQDQMLRTHLSDDDVYIFAFLSALLTSNTASLEKALQARQPFYMIYPMPKRWARPEHWHSLGRLTLKSAAAQTIKLELGGQGQNNELLREQIRLRPRRVVHTQRDFYALHYLHCLSLPDGLLGIHSPARGETRLITPDAWGNIWVYGMEITFCGYMRRGAFRRQASLLPAGSRVFQYPRTATANYALPIKSLRPLNELFQQAMQGGR
jgi:hypothetical protein